MQALMKAFHHYPVLLAVVAGCSAPKPALVEGDVYLVMQSGDTKRGAGRNVYLIANPDSVERDIKAICAGVAAEAKRIGEQASVLMTKSRSLAEAAHEAIATGSSMAAKFAGDRLDSAQAYLARSRPLVKQSAALEDSALFLVALAISRAAVDSADSGMNARFRFDRITPGSYALYSQWSIGERDYRWWTRLALHPGDSLRRDLDNRAEASAAMTCDIAGQ